MTQNLLDTSVCVMLYERRAVCAYHSVDDCLNALYLIDPADILDYDWHVTTFREYATTYHKLGWLGEPSIEPSIKLQ